MSTSIFRFHLRADDPSTVQFRDPFDLHCRWFEATRGDPASVLAPTREPEPVPVVAADGKTTLVVPDETNDQYVARLQAYKALVALIRSVFELPSFDKVTGQGVPDEEALRIFNEWDAWEENVKKNTAVGLTSAAPTTSTR